MSFLWDSDDNKNKKKKRVKDTSEYIGEKESAPKKVDKKEKRKREEKETRPKEKKKQKKQKNKITAAIENLKGSKFRWLNEKLYTTTGKEALGMMKENKELFEIYHQGFASQVEKWPQNPVDIFIDWLKECPESVVADFGCGEAKIARSVSNKVHSFDLYPLHPFVTVCDIANVPLPQNSVDVSIFSLSLMGTNFLDFIFEAHRVLNTG